MTANQQDHTTSALDHVREDSTALDHVHTALRALEQAFDSVESIKVGHVELEEEIAAVTRMTDIVRERIVTRLYSEASRAAYLLAQEVIETVRSRSEQDGPIQWMTGNSFMPPLRSLPEAERVWKEGTDDAWHAFSERFFEVLEEQQIYCTSPEYDNALYCVDLRVWEHEPEPHPDVDDDLANDWRRSAPASEEAPEEDAFPEHRYNPAPFCAKCGGPCEMSKDDPNPSIGELGKWDNNA